jgi:hypothetical protein
MLRHFVSNPMVFRQASQPVIFSASLWNYTENMLTDTCKPTLNR